MRSLLVRYKSLLLVGLVVPASVLAMVLFGVGHRRDGPSSVAAELQGMTAEAPSEPRVPAATSREEVMSEPLPSEGEILVWRPELKSGIWPGADQQFREYLEQANELLPELEEFMRTGTFGRTKPGQMVQKAETLCNFLMFLECRRHGWDEAVPGADRYASDDPVLEDLDAHYDCAYLLYSDGSSMVEVVPFPRDQYPVINRLNDDVARLKPRGKSSGWIYLVGDARQDR